MHIESLATQFVQVGGTCFGFSHGETIVAVIYCTHGVEAFCVPAQRAGFAPGQTWSDATGRFSVRAMSAVW